MEAIEKRPSASRAHALFELATETAEAFLVVGVAKSEHGVLESVQVGRCLAQLPCERACEVGRLAVTVGRDHEQHPCMPGQFVGGQRAQAACLEIGRASGRERVCQYV